MNTAIHCAWPLTGRKYCTASPPSTFWRVRSVFATAFCQPVGDWAPRGNFAFICFQMGASYLFSMARFCEVLERWISLFLLVTLSLTFYQLAFDNCVWMRLSNEVAFSWQQTSERKMLNGLRFARCSLWWWNWQRSHDFLLMSKAIEAYIFYSFCDSLE